MYRANGHRERGAKEADPERKMKAILQERWVRASLGTVKFINLCSAPFVNKAVSCFYGFHAFGKALLAVASCCSPLLLPVVCSSGS